MIGLHLWHYIRWGLNILIGSSLFLPVFCLSSRTSLFVLISLFILQPSPFLPVFPLLFLLFRVSYVSFSLYIMSVYSGLILLFSLASFVIHSSSLSFPCSSPSMFSVYPSLYILSLTFLLFLPFPFQFSSLISVLFCPQPLHFLSTSFFPPLPHSLFPFSPFLYILFLFLYLISLVTSLSFFISSFFICLFSFFSSSFCLQFLPLWSFLLSLLASFF